MQATIKKPNAFCLLQNIKNRCLLIKKEKLKNHVYIDWCVTDTHTQTDTVLQYGRRARTNILWKHSHIHTANLMKKQKRSNFRELKSEHNACSDASQ